ncbi:MAG: hypothetical protein IPG51_14385 [Chloroflexi bacterium]|nr:hypothetical protein [Chloroflexota bacterium]
MSWPWLGESRLRTRTASDEYNHNAADDGLLRQVDGLMVGFLLRLAGLRAVACLTGAARLRGALVFLLSVLKPARRALFWRGRQLLRGASFG